MKIKHEKTNENRKKKSLLKLGLILILLAVAGMAMVGTGAAELKDVSNEPTITLTYWESPNEYDLVKENNYVLVTKDIQKADYQNFFGTSKIYTFSTAADINTIAENVKDNIEYWGKNITYIQVADIDCYDTGGMKSIPGWLCQFNMYGNGHYIINYQQSGENAHGLIESIGHIEDEDYEKYRCTLNGIVMRNCNITSEAENVGAIVGRLEGGELRMIGCSVENSTITTTDDYLGGLIGRLQNKYVVWHGWTSGRLFIYKCNVSNCKIMSKGSYVGGIIGQAEEKRTYIFFFDTLVSSSKIGAFGDYVGGLGGYVRDIDIKRVGLCVNNCILEAGGDCIGGVFGSAENVTANRSEDSDPLALQVIKNTAVLGGEDVERAGVVCGNESDYIGCVSYGIYDEDTRVFGLNRLRLDNCYVCCDDMVSVRGPDTVDGESIWDYLHRRWTDGVMYYTTEKYEKPLLGGKPYWSLDYYWSFVTTIDNSGVSKYHETNIDFGEDFLKNEFNDISAVSQVKTEKHDIANIGKYGHADGYGYFQAKPVTVNYNLTTVTYRDGEPHSSTESWSVQQNENVYATEPVINVPQGYDFNGWYTDKELTQKWDFKSQKLTDDLNLYAKKTEKTYNIVYKDDGNTIKRINNVGYTEEVTIDEYPDSSNDKKFAYWYHDDKIASNTSYSRDWLPGDKVSSLAENGDFNLNAALLPVSEVTLLLETNIPKNSTIVQTVTDGNTFTEPGTDPSRDGYTFKGWYDASGDIFDFSKVYHQNQKAYAKWEEKNYTVKFDKNAVSGDRLYLNAADEDTMSNLNGVLYTQERAVPVNTFENEGYTFIGWNTEPDGTGAVITDTVKISEIETPELEGDSDDTAVTLYAQWVPSYLTLKFEMNNHGVLQIPSEEYAYGRPFQEPSNGSVIDTGYTFGGWYTDNTFTEEFDFNKIYTENKTAYANWEEKRYNIEFDGNTATSGSVSPIENIRYSEEIDLRENGFIKTGYTFTEWNTKADGTGIPYAEGDTVSKLTSEDGGTVTLYAQWVSNDKCSLRFDMNGHGEQIQSETSDEGKFAKPADPSELGYVFQGWYNKSLTEEFNFTGPYSTNQVAYAKWVPVETPIYVWDGSTYVNVKDLGTSSLKDTVTYEDGVLTLNGYNIGSSGATEGAICSIGTDNEHKVNLKIRLNNENMIGNSSSASNAGITAIYGNITIEGSGSLSIYTKAPIEENEMSVGIYSTNDVIINEGKVTIKPTETATESSSILGEWGIWGGNSVEINGGQVDITLYNKLEGVYAILGQNSLKITNGNTTVTNGQIGAASLGDITMTGGTFKSKGNEYGLVASTKINLDKMYSGSIELNVSDRAFTVGNDIEKTVTLGSKTVYAGSSESEALPWTNPSFADLVSSRFNYVKIEGNPESSCIVTFSSVGHGSVDQSSITVKKGTKITFASNELSVGDSKVVATPESGYVFKEWTGIPDSETVTEDMTIMANFEEPKSFTVELTSEDEMGYVTPYSSLNVIKGVKLDCDGNKIKIGDSEIIEIIAIAKSGFVFDNWIITPESGTVTSNLNITANFEEDTSFTVTFQPDDENKGSVSPALLLVPKGTSITSEGNKLNVGGQEVTAIAKSGYVFENWSGLPSDRTVTDTMTIMANFKALTPEPETKAKSASTITSFSGTKSGDTFSFEKSPVVTSATLPGASTAKVTKTSGDGWYNLNMTADGFTGDGSMDFKVPQDVLKTKGFTTKDVGLYHQEDGSWVLKPTTLLKSDNQYAYYKGTFDSCSPFKIDFETDATSGSASTVTEKTVVEEKKTSEETKKVEETTPVQKTTETETKTTEEKKTTAETAKSPVSVLGVLAGLGAAVVLLRRH